MDSFQGKIAVVTGGGTGIGRELVRQLAAADCNVAMCDLSLSNMEETKSLAETTARKGVRVTSHVADVSDEDQMQCFQHEVVAQHETDQIHLLFNNAGVVGGGSVVEGSRSEWEKTFNVCWLGVYLGVRVFLPMLIKAEEGHIINTSSISGLWASIGPHTPHTAYSTAKFAVRGFTEALITDLRLNAPHIKASVVIPGHVGTNIAINSCKMLGDSPLTAETHIRARWKAMGRNADTLSSEDIVRLREEFARRYRDDAPLHADDAARIILDSVKAGKWRILIGRDAHYLDEIVRRAPEDAYNVEFFRKLAEGAGW